MDRDIKKDLKSVDKAMDLTAIRKDNIVEQGSTAYSKPLSFFPLSKEAEDLCQNIDHTLFKLEKDLAYFSFAIREIKDIT